MDLVILAAGMGSRFGGLKQIRPIDENGDFIIDYSIYDAIKAGFDRVVFIIKRDNLEDFENSVAKRIRPFIKVDYAFQDFNSFLPQDMANLTRTKPWGTAHAILCAKDKVKSNFAVINADDFYGRESFKVVYDFLKNIKSSKENNMVAFKAINTVSNNGAVKRGICKINGDNLVSLEESSIRVNNSQLFAKSLLNPDVLEHQINNDTLVSMNLFGLNGSIFDYLEKGFYKFLEDNKIDLQTKEYFIPTILTDLIQTGDCDIKVLPTNERWFGLTYQDDFNDVVAAIKLLREKGLYPNNLWER